MNGEDSPPESETEMDPEMITLIGEIDQRNRPASDFPAASEEVHPVHVGEVRDLGDVLEVPIVEDVVTTEPVVREVIRIPKGHIHAEEDSSAN